MEAFFSGIAKQILTELLKANKNLKIAVAWFTNEDLFEELCRKIQSGLSVELIIINDAINNNLGGLNLQKFVDLGGRLYFGHSENLMHHKFCIIDDTKLINGSYNWTYYAEYKNFENILILNDEDIINSFLKEFKQMMDNLERVSKVEPIPVDITNLIASQSYLDTYIEEYYYKSYRYETVGDYDNAIKTAQRALDLKPTHHHINKQIQNLNKKISGSGSIIYSDVNQTLNNQLADFNQFLKKGVRAYRRKDFVLSKELFLKALSLNNEYGELYFWIALCCWRLNEHSGIIKNCNQAIGLNEKYALAFNLRGIAHIESDDFKKGIDDFTTAITLKPDFYKAYFNRGLVYKKMGDNGASDKDFRKVIEILSSYIRLNEDDEEAHSILADSYSNTNQENEAKLFYSKANQIFKQKQEEDKDYNNEERIAQGMQH